jgi:hypothetical protein
MQRARQETEMAQATAEFELRRPRARQGRFWLYAPFALLLLVVIAWSVAWFMIRNRTDAALDTMLANEKRAGRQWTCADRSVGGFPFRIDVVCSSLTLQRGDVSASFGRVEAVAQVYQPRHVITEVAGPLRFTDGIVTIDGTWRLLETSVRSSPVGFERISLAAEEPNLRIVGAAPTEITFASQALEAHVRPDPGRIQAEGAYDVAVSASQARLPALDAFVGSAEPTDLQIDLTATQAQGFRGRPVVTEIERWRMAGGKLEVLRLAAAKGERRVEAKGEFSLDEMHRPVGQVQGAASGLDGLISKLTGGQAGGNLLSALLGQGPRRGSGNPAAPGGSAVPAPGQPALSPLPPLRLDNGRILLGPFAVPGLRLPALY